MPADRELAALACGVGGLILGMLVPDMLSLAIGATVAIGASQRPWWFVAALAAGACAFGIQVTGWALRVALIAFAAARVASISAVARTLSIGPVASLGLNGLSATALLVAAWPTASRSARIVAVVLFASAVAFKLWLKDSSASVFG